MIHRTLDTCSSSLHASSPRRSVRIINGHVNRKRRTELSQVDRTPARAPEDTSPRASRCNGLRLDRWETKRREASRSAVTNSRSAGLDKTSVGGLPEAVARPTAAPRSRSRARAAWTETDGAQSTIKSASFSSEISFPHSSQIVLN